MIRLRKRNLGCSAGWRVSRHIQMYTQAVCRKFPGLTLNILNFVRNTTACNRISATECNETTACVGSRFAAQRGVELLRRCSTGQDQKKHNQIIESDVEDSKSGEYKVSFYRVSIAVGKICISDIGSSVRSVRAAMQHRRSPFKIANCNSKTTTPIKCTDNGVWAKVAGLTRSIDMCGLFRHYPMA